MSEPIEYEFEVWQDGIPAAEAASIDRERALREAFHYAAMYGQDGPVRIMEVTRTEVVHPAQGRQA